MTKYNVDAAAPIRRPAPMSSGGWLAGNVNRGRLLGAVDGGFVGEVVGCLIAGELGMARDQVEDQLLQDPGPWPGGGPATPSGCQRVQ